MKGLLAVFRYVDDLERALRGLRDAGIQNLQLYSPVPLPEIEDTLIPRPSHVRWFTLSGALAGITLALVLTIGTSLAWPLVVGGKPIISVPPFLIITFELMVLIGSLANLAGLFATGKLPRRFPWDPYDPRFSDDRFGLLVRGSTQELEKARSIFQEAQAEEIHEVD